AVDLGAAEIEMLGDQRQRFPRHVAERRLHGVQERQQRPLHLPKLLENGAGALGDGTLVPLRPHATSSFAAIAGRQISRGRRASSIAQNRCLIEEFYQNCPSSRASRRAWWRSAETSGVCGSRWAATSPTRWL